MIVGTTLDAEFPPKGTATAASQAVLKVSDYSGDGVPLVFVRNIRSGDFVGLDPKFVSAEKATELAAAPDVST